MVAQMSTWGPSVLQLEVEKLAAMAEVAINDLGTPPPPPPPPFILPTLALPAAFSPAQVCAAAAINFVANGQV
eukprot:COSAG04_NODE_634_length_11718_cov_8.281780_9_plen_73_part_00